jgi:PIN domain.
MSFIRTDPVAFDTNVLIMALRRYAEAEAAIELVRVRLRELRVVIPLQVVQELHRNLTHDEETELRAILAEGDVDWSYLRAGAELISAYESRGAKKGDAIIAAQLEASGVKCLISQNRHFLAEIADLGFDVFTPSQVLRLLSV